MVEALTAVESTPYDCATVSSRNVSSSREISSVVSRNIPIEVTIPMNEGEVVGADISGDELGKFVGEAVMNTSQMQKG